MKKIGKSYKKNTIFLFLSLICVISFTLYLSIEKKLSSDELKAQLCKFGSWVEVTNNSCGEVYSFSEDGTMERRGQIPPEYQHYKWVLEGNTLTVRNIRTNDISKSKLSMYSKYGKYSLKITSESSSSITYSGEYPR